MTHAPFAAIDFETADDGRDSACAVGVARVDGAEVVRVVARLIRPPRAVMKFQRIHGISLDMVRDEPPFAEVWRDVLPLLDGVDFLAAHNAPFDRSVMTACCRAAGITPPPHRWVCTLDMAKRRWRTGGHRLPDVCGRLGIRLTDHHHAGADAEACARVLVAMEGRRAVAGPDLFAAPEPPAVPPPPPLATPSLEAELARLVRACPDMRQVAADVRGQAATRGDAEAAAIARVAADCGERYAEYRGRNRLGWETPSAPPGEVRGEGVPDPGRRVVWVGWDGDGGPLRMGVAGGVQSQRRKAVEADLPAAARYWAEVGGAYWTRVPGA